MRAKVFLNVNFPAIAGITILPLVGQGLLVDRFPPMRAHELAWVLFSMSSYSALLAAVAAAVGGCAARRGAGWWPALIWMLLVGSASMYLADTFSYMWLRLHVDETLPLLVENIPLFQTTMRSKMAALVGAAAAGAAFFVAGTAGVRYAMAHVRLFAMPVKASRIAVAIGVLAVLVVAERLAAPHMLSLGPYEAKIRVLWQPGIYVPRHPQAPAYVFEIEAPQFRQVPDEPSIVSTLSALDPADLTRPRNIFFFIIDSLREDVVTPDMMPHLSALQRRALPISAGVAASNVTHMSWFSLLHGINAIYWSVTAHQATSRGAIPMRVLSKTGYRLNAYSAANLEYFGFERSVFGNNPALPSRVIDLRELFDQTTDRTPADIDTKVMARIGADLDTLRPDSREFFLVTFVGPHHDYSWAARYQPRFLPYEEHVNVFVTPRPEQVPRLKNRYLNAVNYADMLIGEFLQKLEARGLMEHSIIVVTGDHGEEFYERGNLTHSSDLNRFQVRTPLIVVVPGAQMPSRAVASHIDIFPTIFDALGIGDQSAALLEGASLLKPDRRGAAFSAMSSSYSPDRALLDAGDIKLVIEFEGIRKMGRTVFARRLTAASVLTRDDHIVTPGSPGQPSIEEIRARFLPALDTLVQVSDSGF